jgi:hypothetical protein
MDWITTAVQTLELSEVLLKLWENLLKAFVPLMKTMIDVVGYFVSQLQDTIIYIFTETIFFLSEIRWVYNNGVSEQV